MFKNEISMKFKTGDGRAFRAERGTVSASLGFEEYGMFVLKFKCDWGMHTTTSFGMDHVVDLDVPIQDRVRQAEDYFYPFLLAVIRVFQTGTLEGIQNREIYMIFSETYKAHEAPLGFVDINNPSNAIIFKDFFALYGK